MARRGIQEQAANAPIVALLVVAAGLVLLAASANVAGLLLARGLRRRREIAIRLAIGASRGRVIRLLLIESVMLAAAGGIAGLLIVRRGMAIVLVGIIAGLAACVIAGPFLAHLLYGVGARDPLTRAIGPAGLTVVAALAIALPARRAMKQNPIVALRVE